MQRSALGITLRGAEPFALVLSHGEGEPAYPWLLSMATPPLGNPLDFLSMVNLQVMAHGLRLQNNLQSSNSPESDLVSTTNHSYH